jgi:hypothetical protein
MIKKGMSLSLLVSAMMLGGCAGRDRDDWLKNWPVYSISDASPTPVKGLNDEKHHF